MIDITTLLLEALNKTGFSDEQALVEMWNFVVNDKKVKTLLKSPQNLIDLVKDAKKNPSHPLNIKNIATTGFLHGVKKGNEAGYYQELENAASTVHALANHPSLAKAVEKKLEAKGTGTAVGVLSPMWLSSKALNKTSKADLMIGNFSVSLKKGQTQLMSAQPEEMNATYDQATNRYMEADKKFTKKSKEEVMSGIKRVTKCMMDMDGASRTNQGVLRDKAQKIINKLHADYPDLIYHVSYEAATGNGKFGEGKTGSARFLVSSMGKGVVHIHDTETNHEPIVMGNPRIALSKHPKSNGIGNIKIDYKPIIHKTAPEGAIPDKPVDAKQMVKNHKTPKLEKETKNFKRELNQKDTHTTSVVKKAINMVMKANHKIAGKEHPAIASGLLSRKDFGKFSLSGHNARPISKPAPKATPSQQAPVHNKKPAPNVPSNSERVIPTNLDFAHMSGYQLGQYATRGSKDNKQKAMAEKKRREATKQ